MRAFSVLILLFIVFPSLAVDFSVFEKDGFFGIKNRQGEVTVPPVYQHLGWPDGSIEVADGLIGFKEAGFWGLLSVKNKILAEPVYYSVEPFQNGLIKASIKGKFSNQLFYGLLNETGKTIVSCNYFTLEPLGKDLLVSQYDSKQRFGVITYTNQIKIPIRYARIALDNKLILAYTVDGMAHLFKSNGDLIATNINSLSKKEFGYLASKNGHVGLINFEGVVVEDFLHKEIQVIDNVVIPFPFPKWSVYRGMELQSQYYADSLHLSEDRVNGQYVNGVHQFVSFDSSLQFANHYLMEVTDYHYLLKNATTNMWSAHIKTNNGILEGYDSIAAFQYTLWAKNDELWQLFNRYGKQKNRFAYQEVKEGLNGQFVVNLNGHYGILGPLGEEVTPCKYDLIEKESGVYKVNYLNRWGALDERGEWLVRSEYEDVLVFDGFLVGKKGFSYAYYNKQGLLRKTVLRPLQTIGDGILVGGDSLQGVLNLRGELIVMPEYDKIEWVDGYYKLRRNNEITLVDSDGKEVYGASIGIQEVGGLSEELFLLKVNNRWGFFDLEARLRISNRYDSASVFNEGYAPVRMRGKWGFINKEESLSVQPFYNWVSSFNRGLSIVKIGDRYGMIDYQGNEVIGVGWKAIKRLTTGNYLLQDDYDKLGLVSSKGEILLRPSFDSLADFKGRVIVENNDKKGVLSYSGKQIFRLDFKEIEISDDYTILKH